MAIPHASSLCFVILLCSAAAEAIDGGFMVELIHRDAPKSPFYDPLETPYQRVGKNVRRSIARLAGLRSIPKEPYAHMTNVEGEYLIKIAVGSPPVQIVGCADTGSDLIWTQCTPCNSCFRQDVPMFDPSKSRTYKVVPYHSPKCPYRKTSSSPNGECLYSVTYGDQSYSKGKIATDVISLDSTSGSSIKFPETVFGCGHNNGGNFSSHSSGVVGLGSGEASLISQIGRNYGGMFSYCLLPLFSSSSSKLSFGSRAHVSGRGTVSTPYIQKPPETFYYLTLEGISINGKKFRLGSSSRGAGEGNIFIDSGATLTSLPPDLYAQIEAAVTSAITLPRVQDPSGNLKLCYRSSRRFTAAPNITVHFTNADVKLYWYNAFVHVAHDVACFSFVPASSGMPIYGNLAQTNFLVGYDTARRKLSFKPTDCRYH